MIKVVKQDRLQVVNYIYFSVCHAFRIEITVNTASQQWSLENAQIILYWFLPFLVWLNECPPKYRMCFCVTWLIMLLDVMHFMFVRRQQIKIILEYLAFGKSIFVKSNDIFIKLNFFPILFLLTLDVLINVWYHLVCTNPFKNGAWVFL